jgi:hypothetical protein
MESLETVIDWNSLIATVLTLSLALGQYELGNRPVLAPWAGIGSSAYIWLDNQTDDSLPVSVRAPAVDTATRFLGIITPHDETLFRLPYADTNVLLTIGTGTVELKVQGPGVYTLPYADN